MAPSPTSAPRLERVPLHAAGVLLGAGLGGFADGIVLHQILQWHNMLSARLPPDTLVAVKTNMLWDGLFHAAVWAMTAVGLALLWRVGHRTDVPWSGRTFAGALVGGWGVFNIVEGLVNHQILGLHHVHEASAQRGAWDIAFLVFGAALLALGVALVRAGRGDVAPRGHGGSSEV